jgi:DNA-directed RNA polymerase omega subunit
MLNNPPITGILKKISNPYTLVMAVSKRARQITTDSQQYNISAMREKAVSLAAEDVYNGNVIILNTDDEVDATHEDDINKA